MKHKLFIAALILGLMMWGSCSDDPLPPPPQPVYECNDGIDNDGDGLIDLSDPGCNSATDNDEYTRPDPIEKFVGTYTLLGFALWGTEFGPRIDQDDVTSYSGTMYVYRSGYVVQEIELNGTRGRASGTIEIVTDGKWKTTSGGCTYDIKVDFNETTGLLRTVVRRASLAPCDYCWSCGQYVEENRWQKTGAAAPPNPSSSLVEEPGDGEIGSSLIGVWELLP